MIENNKIVLVGYSGHALVVADALISLGYDIVGYLERKKRKNNLLNLSYLGYEQDKDVIKNIKNYMIFPAIGDNHIRAKVIEIFEKNDFEIPLVIHPQANVSNQTKVGKGTFVCRGACVNPFAKIGNAVIINTGVIVEHECVIGDFVHIAPGAVVTGNVKIGKNSFIGANSVIKQGISIGENVIIGAGAVVIRDANDNEILVGNPSKRMIK